MTQSQTSQYTEVGYVARAHGTAGEVMIIPEFAVPDLLQTEDLVRIKNHRGDLIPARIEKLRVDDRKNRISFFVKFDHVADRTEAEQLKGHKIFLEAGKVETLIGEEEEELYMDYEVFDEHDAYVGLVEDIIPNPAHPILEVITDGGHLLVPAVDEYIRSVDEEGRRLYCQNLDQLTGL